jgi:penicillin amidase
MSSESTAGAKDPRSVPGTRRPSRFWRYIRWTPLIALLLILGGAGWVWHVLRGSLPPLDGTLQVAGITAPVRIERDAVGMVTITAQDRADLAFATGFAHGQDRYFQMDLLRRSAAGELAELAGGSPLILELDRAHRRYQFRRVAAQVIADATEDERAGITAYAAGVNAGLASLDRQPPEYYLLGGPPRPWTPDDSLLVLFSMFIDLQERDIQVERVRGLLHETFPAEVANFLTPQGSPFDAPIDSSSFRLPPTPGPEVLDLRAAGTEAAAATTRVNPPINGPRPIPGSNNWAVSGQHTADGRAIVADDMHLRLMAPNIWYRAQFVWKDADGGEHRVTGASLPGTPVIVVGSNGHVAWGFTNSQGDWSDLVVIEVDPADPDKYLTPDGPRAFEISQEIIKVRGQADETLDIQQTIWGPIVAQDAAGRPLALHWTARDPAAVNFQIQRLEQAATLEEALDIANSAGAPAQNFVVADDQGRIAWTILGRIPRRQGHDGRLPRSWADGTCGWNGWLTAEEYPRIVAPEGGRIWSANSRVVGGDMLAAIGDGGYDLGARTTQIRDHLAELKDIREADMLAIQLDDRALFLERWRKLLLDLLTDEILAGHPSRRQARELLASWDGRATPDSVAMRLTHDFWWNVHNRALDPFLTPLRQQVETIQPGDLRGVDAPVWQLIIERPPHLLDPRYATWDDLLLAALDEVLDSATKDGAALEAFTWGSDPANISAIGHPLSAALSPLARWLEMPHEPLPGAGLHMPRVHRAQYGASQRMAVSPGREADGYFHMPCGQSGHPLSPHYRDGHAAWVQGEPSPFLPGPVAHELTLRP